MNMYDQLHGGIVLLWSVLMFFGVTRSTVYREDWWLSGIKVGFPEGQTRWVASNLLDSLVSFVLAIVIDETIKGTILFWVNVSPYWTAYLFVPPSAYVQVSTFWGVKP